MADGPGAVEAAAAAAGRGASRAAAPARFALRPQPRAVVRASGDEDEEMDDDEDDGVEAGKVRPRQPARCAGCGASLREGAPQRWPNFSCGAAARCAPLASPPRPARLATCRGGCARRAASRRAGARRGRLPFESRMTAVRQQPAAARLGAPVARPHAPRRQRVSLPRRGARALAALFCGVRAGSSPLTGRLTRFCFRGTAARAGRGHAAPLPARRGGVRRRAAERLRGSPLRASPAQRPAFKPMHSSAGPPPLVPY